MFHLRDWANEVKQGDYVIVISNSNILEESIREVTKTTENSIFVSKMQFLKDTKLQMNMKRRIEPFMAQHKNLLNKNL